MAAWTFRKTSDKAVDDAFSIIFLDLPAGKACGECT
jgi:hypothetical protein